MGTGGSVRQCASRALSAGLGVEHATCDGAGENSASVRDGGVLQASEEKALRRAYLSGNARIRPLWDRHGVICIEDATYTFLGRSDHDGRRVGSYGHYAVLNFSEGKIVAFPSFPYSSGR